MRIEIWQSTFCRYKVIWFVSIDFIENSIETTHDDIQYSPGGERLDDGIFVSVASAKLLLMTRQFIPNRLTVRSGKIRYEIPDVRSSTGWPKYTVEPIILVVLTDLFYFRVDAWSVGLCPPDPPAVISYILFYPGGGSVPVEESTTLVHYCLIW